MRSRVSPLLLALSTGACGYTGLDLESNEDSGGAGAIVDGGDDEDDLVHDCGEECRLTGALIEENFEETPDGRQVTRDNASLGLTSEKSYSGNSALYAEQGGDESEAEVRVSLGPLLETTLYFRAWVYLPENSVNGRIKLLGLNDQRGRSTDVSVLSEGRAEIYFETDEQRARSEAGAYEEGRWFCLQVSSFIHDDSGWMRVAVDGDQVVELPEGDSLPGDGISIVVYGMAETSLGQSGGSLYLDEVALSDSPLPCE